MSEAARRGAKPVQRRAPGMTIEDREDQMVALAVNLAEDQLRNGTAKSQVIVHYLQLGSTKARLERERLIEENKLLRAKTEALQSEKRTEELYKNAIEAMRAYQGHYKAGGEDD